MGVWIETDDCTKLHSDIYVTPFVGVWIETIFLYPCRKCECVTPFVGVWIETIGMQTQYRCELSHTLRGCVDWNWYWASLRLAALGHTLRGCVDWNIRNGHRSNSFNVTPFVGVWIETEPNWVFAVVMTSHPSWVCGLKLLLLQVVLLAIRHTLRGCVDWNTGLVNMSREKVCHTLRGCVDWNKLTTDSLPNWGVTPFVGVWIETLRVHTTRQQN